MSTVSGLIEQAFTRLSERPGFVERPDQRQLSLLVSDLIEGASTGAIEAPTGLGKSLACLIPAIAHALHSGKRTVIATYTNILAEQYWHKDLPLALSLFGDDVNLADLKTAFQIGRQRYICLSAVKENAPDLLSPLRRGATLGIETEFRSIVPRPQRQLTPLWQKIVAPPVCPGRLCPDYVDCYYYKARRLSEKAHVVITNHSVIVQDALVAQASEDGKGLLGDFDFLILDEAHDFPQAALNGLEFELSGPRLGMLIGIASRLEQSLHSMADSARDAKAWHDACYLFTDAMERCQRLLIGYSLDLGQPGILTMTPSEVLEHPQVKLHQAKGGVDGAKSIAQEISQEVRVFVDTVNRFVERWRNMNETGESTKLAQETARHYLQYIEEIGHGASLIFEPRGVAVSYVGRTGSDAMIRQDLIGLAEPLKELIWDRKPYACLSATLATDGTFDFFRRSTGADPAYEEILPSPFDYASNAALYVPKEGRIPDPTIARREGTEDLYFKALADEISEIIRACSGRTLALFHSRKEMEAVMRLMYLPPELPILVQGKQGVGTVGEQFKSETNASLFALRSFWTGFDAPGETLSCVVLVRVPFEVPFDPPQIARLAWMQSQGLDAFGGHTLALAKMIMRQGAGRLIRRAEDTGIIALLDPRLRSKRYGEEIIANLPSEMRRFDDIYDAVGWIGLESSTLLL